MILEISGGESEVIGAIAGDIIGSAYELHYPKSADFLYPTNA